ncbi:MAG: magnesium transporter, partial [Rhodoglobus sp.]|nr:magnesium transporter [Rhodoglobus sp.]
MAQTRCYRAGDLVDEGFPLDDVDKRLAKDRTVVWVDLLRPGPDELQIVADELGLHSLAVEDA